MRDTHAQCVRLDRPANNELAQVALTADDKQQQCKQQQHAQDNMFLGILCYNLCRNGPVTKLQLYYNGH